MEEGISNMNERLLTQRESEADFVRKRFDLAVLLIIFLATVAAAWIQQQLFAGDWSFWIDLKDRMWWPVIVPIATICFPAAVQAALWTHWKFPAGATMVCFGLLLGQWLNRIINFWAWAKFPINLVFPETLLPQAIVLDGILMITNNFVVTALIGGELWGWLFYPSNWPMIAPYHVPVEYHGQLLSVADLIQYQYIRTSTPEYLRMVETGTMRSFAGGVLGVSAFFSGFISILMYFIWWYMGYFFAKPIYLKAKRI
jgi:methane/ammonia monooxygenase subunit A